MRLEALVRAAVVEALAAGGKPVPAEVPIERTTRPEHGDLSTRVAFLLARELGAPPATIAAELAARLAADPSFLKVQPAGGFVNFTLHPTTLHSVLRQILSSGDRYGRGEEGEGKTVQVEFVSSNPTGPLTIGHLRQAALGDVVAELYAQLGWRAVREYYLNDEGRQMDLLAQSLWARYRQALCDDQPIPEGGYQGAYLAEIGAELAQAWGNAHPTWDEAARAVFRSEAVARMMVMIHEDLDAIGVRFDVWTKEGDLHRRGLVQEALARLKQRGAVYEKDGALWLASTRHGLDRDPVLLRSDGTPTYTLVDIAYHLDKARRGFDLVINVQGADHVDEQRQVLLALKLLGLPDGFVRYCLHQFVTLKGEEGIQRMSTRAGRFLRLKDLVADVGRDVARYFMVMRKPGSHLVFDYALARDTSLENPVYYVQYGYTRIASLFREAERAGERPPDLRTVDLSPLTDDRELALIRELDRFPDVVEVAAHEFAPHLLCEYLEGLSGLLHPYYAHVRILGQGPATPARLALLGGIQLVLGRGLGILGVSAPEAM
ncbi:MAG: arginine--tRNA ligase [Candidatus Bipolaricaulis anaerobius]|nr:arginine--tRNA ligase [Candidatus Bipolaricaulis anaerobius]